MLELRALYFHVDGLRARGFQLSLGLSNVDGGGKSAVVASLRQVERFLVRDDGGVEKLFLRVQSSQRKIVERQLSVDAEVDVCQIRGGGLRFRAARLRRCGERGPTRRLRS